MQNNKPEIFELKSLNWVPEEKVEIILTNHMYYFDFENDRDLLKILETKCKTEILVCIDLMLPMKDEFLEAAKSHPYHFFEQKKRRFQYVQVRLEKEKIKESESFFEFINVIAGMNQFIFIVKDPKGELPQYLVNDKVRVDTSNGEEIFVFDYDRDGVFIFS